MDRATALSRDYADQFSADNNVEAHVATGPVAHTVLAGFDYQHISSHYVDGFGSAPPLDIVAPNYSLPITIPATSLTKGHLNQ